MKQNTKFALTWMICMIMFSWALVNVSAEVNEYAPVKQNDCVLIKQTCASCSYVNLSISYPNSTLAITNDDMTSVGGGTWTYNFCNTTNLGRYDITGSGDIDGTPTGFDTIWFEVTDSGKSIPDGIVVIVFSLGFLIIIGLLGWLMISNIGHFAQLDYDLSDLIKNVSLYFVLIGFYFLHGQYLGNVMIDNILVWAMGIAGFTNVAVSFIAFIFSHIKRVAEQKIKLEENGE